MKNKKLLEKSNEIYDAAFVTGKNKSSRTLLDDTSRQYRRFSEILNFIDDLDSSVLDIGCGNGLFAEFLNFSGFTGKYTGVDINENLLSEAKKDYPHLDFRKTDILKEKIEKFDYVVMSGLFNVNFGQDFVFVKNFIKSMAEISEKKVIFNAISTYVNYKDEHMYYLDPCSLIPFVVQEISPTFEIRHSFLPYNFTISIYKKNNWQSIMQE